MMNKTILFSAVSVLLVTNANAGLLGNLFGAKEVEPQTLQEACNTDEITAVCPEIILGTKTIQECLMDNVSSLSKKCAKYVKKSAMEKVDAVKDTVANVTGGVENVTVEQRAAVAAQKAAAKTAKKNLKASLKETKAAAKAFLAAEKAQLVSGLADTQTAE